MLKRDRRQGDRRKVVYQAPIRAHMPSGTEEILNERTLAFSHRRLDELLRPEMRVLAVEGRVPG